VKLGRSTTKYTIHDNYHLLKRWSVIYVKQKLCKDLLPLGTHRLLYYVIWFIYLFVMDDKSVHFTKPRLSVHLLFLHCPYCSILGT